MVEYIVDCTEAANDFLDFADSLSLDEVKLSGNTIEIGSDSFEFVPEFEHILDKWKPKDQYANDLIYGKNKIEKIVSVEVKDEKIFMFLNDGTVKEMDNRYWFLSNKPLGEGSYKLEGNQTYKYMNKFIDEENFKNARNSCYKKRIDHICIYDPAEAAMVLNGITLFKGLKVQDVSVLSSDIETTGVTHSDDSEVLLISNTYRDRFGKITKKLFSLEDYETSASLIHDWCEWIVQLDPSILLYYNGFGFDITYLSYCYKREFGADLPIGKYGEELEYSKKPRKFRKDGSQDYEYYDARAFGRQIIDGFFLAIKYDFSRKYLNYRLKNIIEQEGLEKKGRIKWDFEKNKPWFIFQQMLNGSSEGIKLWEDFKEYCKDDADDALKLYDLMIPAYFYYMQNLPMSFQTMNNTATGRQINSMLVRAYLQDGHSVPKTSERRSFQGAISFGVPGLYSHVKKFDVQALYPSIIISKKIYCKDKDPKAYFYEMIKYFKDSRQEDKRMAKETGDRYYTDIEQAKKIVANSGYGVLGTPGLNFNYFNGADQVTETGRDIVQKGIEWVTGRKAIQVPKLLKNGTPETYPSGQPKKHWCLPESLTGATGKGFKLVNVDTDSFSYSPGKKLTDEEYQEHLDEVNSLFEDGIVWEDDGYYKKVLVVKTKNYVLDDGKKLKIKGSGLVGTMKEVALQEFIKDIINLLLKNKRDHIFSVYNQYANEIKDIQDISRWSMRKTITASILNPERKQEEKVLEAISNISYQEGDKVNLFSIDEDNLGLVEDFNGDYDKDTYFNKLHDTLSVFETVIDPTIFPNYKTGRNKALI